MTKRVNIIGAGIGGLTASIALAKIGYHVSVLEQADELSDVGAGIQLSPNAMQVLSSFELQDEVKAFAYEPQHAVMRHYQTGNAELSIRLREKCEQHYGQPYLHVHRADLHKTLTNAAKKAGVSIHLSKKVTGYTQNENEVTLLLNSKEKITSEIVIAADGINSAITKSMHVDTQPVFTEQVAWRGLIPSTSVPDGLIPPDATVWLGPEKHFVTYYVRNGEMINFVAVEERREWTEESWNKKGDVSQLRELFSGWDERITTLLNATEESYQWGLFDRTPLASWSDNRVVLLGDACHPMLPFMAQGAAMAIEDAYVLSELLGKHNYVDAFSKYETIRKPRTSDLQNLSRENARLFHLSSEFEQKKRRLKFAIANSIPALAYARLDKIYGYDVTKLDFS